MEKRRNIIFLLMIFLGLFKSPVIQSLEQQKMNMVVTAAFVSEQGISVYQDLASYLESKTPYKVSIVSGSSYEISDLLLEKGYIQVGFVCGLPYTENVAKDIYRLVAMPTMSLRAGVYEDTRGYANIPGKYYSYTIVAKDSPITNWAELKGKSYAFSEQNSNSGYNLPRYKLLQMGYKSWNDYFSRVVSSGSHETSIRLVASGAVTASSVDSLVLDYERSIGDPAALNVRVIEHLFEGGSGIPPVVISNKAPVGMYQQLQNALLTMHENSEGQKILQKALIERFLPPDDKNYDDIRRYNNAAIKAGFIDAIQ